MPNVEDAESFLKSRDLTCCESTLATYRQCLGAFMKWAGEQPLVSATINDYFRHERARGLGPTSQRNTYRMLKTWCRWLVEEERLARDPFSGRGKVQPPPLKRKRQPTYSEAEIVALLRAAAPGGWKRDRKTTRQQWEVDGPLAREAAQGRALVLLAVDSAMRAGEMAALTCGQVRAASLIVEGKGGHTDVAFITAATRAALVQLAGDREDSAPLFRDWNGRGSVRGLRGLLVRLSQRAGVVLPPRPVHALRHYAARAWVKAKLPDLVIQQLMRHANLSTTQIYTRLDEDELAHLHAEASSIGRLLERAAGE